MTDQTPTLPGPRLPRIKEMLRVDHAGEYGAVTIYRGQHAVFSRVKGKERMADLLKEMEEGEQPHLATFSELLRQTGTRPTLLAPLWNAAGFALGAGTALMGEKAAMACTTAVESVIEKHYAEQAGELGDHEPELKATIEKFREEELEHHDTAISEGAEDAFGYSVLKGVIGAGCRLAIKLAEKV
ncbi:demethoxyubiquinone hydroxylase family protein [Parvularcula sp. LCG005]|uniref:demethoxyubiquinone hydroxylase family protein n=1 Tax=Parvularcula sp. LCG005 TaxID=3078805 RepID=UPI0029434EFE|nr:demethoxyubiquinone hydroxylase family protein [Parvularcula sp. LCG005]WOI54441.1 demethoxyubiquinone hydroxylase family protein [Parvularcula sp. LCG005]